MRILYVISRLDQAGPVNQLYDLITNLPKDKYQGKVLTLQPEGEQSRINDFLSQGIEVSSLLISSKLSFQKKVEGLNKEVEAYKPDIIHSECLPADLVVAACRGRGAKKVTTMHCDIYTDYPILKRGAFSIPILPGLLVSLHQKSLKKFDLLIACSETLKKIYEERFSEVCAVQNGISTKKFFYEEHTEDRRKLLGLREDLPVVLVVGSLDERKNTEFIVRALKDATMDPAHPFQLVFLGEGKLLESLKRRTVGTGVIFRGKVSNVQEYMSCADIFLSASRSEGLPLVVLEAGCCGMKMVLSAIPQHKEIFENQEGEDVFFFEPEREEDLREKMLLCLQKADNSKGISEYFCQRFGAERMAKEYREVYDTIGNQSDLMEEGN